MSSPDPNPAPILPIAPIAEGDGRTDISSVDSMRCARGWVMESFWDSSAVVALLLQEPGTPVARKHWEKTESVWAWHWMIVEVESALARRRASPVAWVQWGSLARSFQFLEVEREPWDSFDSEMGKAVRRLGVGVL